MSSHQVVKKLQICIQAAHYSLFNRWFYKHPSLLCQTLPLQGVLVSILVLKREIEKSLDTLVFKLSP